MLALRKIYQGILKSYITRSLKRSTPFFPVGFHGDRYLLELVDSIIQRCDYFIETGTNVGSTLAFVARKYPEIHCISCEPNTNAFQQAVKNVAAYRNVTLYNETSQDFLERLKEISPNCEVLFWLDAHGYGFKWPLKEELAFITTFFERAYILIDDFKVPGLDCFDYDEYQDQICSFDYVKDALNTSLNYRLYYPCYTDRTSQFHPLRGWGLIEFGHTKEVNFPNELLDKIRLVQ